MGLKRLDYDVIEDYNDILRSASTISYMDSSIELIVMEEIPAYFAGQKSIEDVAAIIENRAQTVIDERS